jgi:hypothetical protein
MVREYPIYIEPMGSIQTPPFIESLGYPEHNINPAS